MEFKHLEEVLDRYGKRAVELYKDNLARKGVNASSALSNSVKVLMEHKGNIYEVSLSLLDYWKYVEYGRGPGKMPPVDKILEWVRIKPVIPRPYNGKLPTEKQLAFLIARKIGREGTKPRNVLAGTMEELNEQMIPEIEEALSTDILDNIDEAFAILATRNL